jgi:hypothetical protein
MEVMGLRLRKSMMFAAICGLFIILFLVSGFNFYFFLLALIAGGIDTYYYHRGE